MSEDTPTIDSLLENLGGCGTFQFLAVLILYGGFMPIIWSLLFFTFGGYNPGWRCGDSFEKIDGDNATMLNNSIMTDVVSLITSTSTPNDFNKPSARIENDSFTYTSSCEAFSSCNTIIYSDEASTIVTEWNLACDNSHILSSIMSLQMGGLLLGALVSGPLSNLLGRKPTHFLSLAGNAVLNLIMAFSVDLKMFIVCRFLVGVTCGGITCCSDVYAVEFANRRGRTWIPSIPKWIICSTIYSALTITLKDWRMLHIATACIAFVLIIPVVWLPESLRWLTMKGKVDEAIQTASKIGRINRLSKEADMQTIYFIAEEERKIRLKTPNVGIVQLYKGEILKYTVVLSLNWFMTVLVFYVILLDVSSLSGNFYLNFMIISVIPLAMVPFLSPIANYIGRKRGIIFLLFACCVCFMIVASLHFMPFIKQDTKGLVTQIFTFLALILVDGAWLIGTLFTSELYPTSLRSLGYAHGSCMSRIGGIVAPFVLPPNPDLIYISHIVIGASMLITGFSLMLLPETRKRPMTDLLMSSSHSNLSTKIAGNCKQDVIAEQEASEV